ncbi:uncharacterized protein GGS22DRAFT_21061 [Annulohypoxylon maeteangense]|uniref:uncharacterized protein n=1 Tax=Annulohypoxylon maeteangense TaxID=1927788 RepID=UPI002007EF1E|nr:uncharacterized protein GGS22DRAFT_21061 [Annulohypoxylon maeteangense]KAI0884241.1 hypothetical protein GGS22DRAFT_21061 [Annulohypoxylon maeteangense]
MSASNSSSISEPHPLSIAKSQRLRKWKQQLLFNVESPDGTSGTKVTGFVDGGSDVSMISKKIAKKAGLEIIPLKPEARPDLEGLEGRLLCQPIGFVYAKIRQADLSLDTTALAFYVVDVKKIQILLGSEFGQEYGIESKIYEAVENEIDPVDWDRDRPTCHNVCVLFDARSKGRQRKEEEQTQQQRKQHSEQVLLAIEAMKTQRNLQASQSAMGSYGGSASFPSTISSLSASSAYSNFTGSSASTAPSSCDATQTGTVNTGQKS